MENPTKAVHICAFDLLLREEVMRHESHSPAQMRWSICIRHNHWLILDDAFDGGKSLGELETNVAVRASNFDNNYATIGFVPYTFPSIVVEKMRDL